MTADPARTMQDRLIELQSKAINELKGRMSGIILLPGNPDMPTSSSNRSEKH